MLMDGISIMVNDFMACSYNNRQTDQMITNKLKNDSSNGSSAVNRQTKEDSDRPIAGKRLVREEETFK